MDRMLNVLATFVLVFLAFAGSAEAYIGPGVGVGTIGVVLGILGSLFLALFAVVYYPLKRAFKKSKAKSEPEQTQEEEA